MTEPYKAEELTVYAISPAGNVPKGTTINVKIYSLIPATKPGGLSAAPAGPYTASQSVTISWPAYSGCPSNKTFESYNIAIENGVVTSTNPVPAGTTSATITLRSDPGTTKVSYTASCSGSPSPVSDVLTLTVP